MLIGGVFLYICKACLAKSLIFCYIIRVFNFKIRTFMRGESPRFGGEIPEMSGKSPEKKEKETELVPYGELMSQVGEQMSKVVSSLEKEREMAADIRKMGGKVTRETAERIAGLEKQKNSLLGVYEDVLEPVRKDADMAFLEHAELAVPKPEEIDALMTDPDEIEVTDDMIIETQTSDELANLEKGLRDEADAANEEMIGIIEKMRDMRNASGPLSPDLGDPEIRKGTIGILQQRYEDLKNRSMLIDDPATKAEMRQIDAQILPMMSEDINAMGAQERAAADEKIKAANLRMLESRFGELRNYVVSINEKLKDVRTNLGFARKMDEKEGRKAA